MATLLPRRPQRSRTSFLSPASNYGHSLVHLGFEGSRHLVPERLPSARRDRPVTARVIDVDRDAVENIRKISPTLKRVDMSGLGLDALDEDLVEDLAGIEKLDLAYNQLTEKSFPAAFKKLERLFELAVHHNDLAQIPKVMRRLKNLQRLQLGSNKLQSSEGLQKLKRLLVLVLDNNEIDALSKELFTNLKKIEILHCSQNRLKELPSDVRRLRFLRNLDISGNSLTALPQELFLLPRLEVLDASRNRITRLPTINMKGRLTHRFTSVDVSENDLIKFPEHLLLMADKLDLSRNKIKVIPSNKIRKLDWRTTLELDVCDNPLVTPPPEVCECGTKAIMQYFHDSAADMKIYEGVKLLVLGAPAAGKTSLVQTLVDQQSRLATEEEATIGVELYDMTADVEVLDENGDSIIKLLQMSFWDFSGDPQFLYPNYFFVQQPCLIMLVFNMADYSRATFKERLGSWLNWVIARTNRVVVLPVGTHSDRLPRAKAREICAEVSESLQTFNASYKEDIQREIKKIESRAHISPALTEQLKSYMALLKVQCTIYDKVIAISSKTMEGTDQLLGAVQTLAQDKTVFPNVLRTIPTFWGDVENHVEDRGYAMEVPVLTWEEYEEEITAKFGMKHLIRYITAYLHDTGRALWFSSHPTLKDYVILRPTFLTDLLKVLFCRDVSEDDHNLEDGLKRCGVVRSKFNNWKNSATEDGLLERNFIKCIWAQYLDPDFNRPLLRVLAILVKHFELGYVPRKPSRVERSVSTISRTSEVTVKTGASKIERQSSKVQRKESVVTIKSEKSEPETDIPRKPTADSQSPPKISRVIVPWLRQTKKPKNFSDEYDLLRDRPCLAAVFRFPRYTPPGFFETMIVRAHREKHELTLIHHWSKGFYARHREKEMRLYLLRIDHEDGSTCMRVEVRHEVSVGADKVSQLWSVMLPYLRDVEDLLGSFAGARVERLMECPGCRSLSFLGEWLAPKELQNSACRQCEMCKTDVDTSYLIQPKEKRTVEDFLRQKLQLRQSQIQAAARHHSARHVPGHVTLEKIPDEREEEEEENNSEVFRGHDGDHEEEAVSR